MTSGQPASGFRYWAFISYSHKDASWGSWLHKALETYRVPRRLVGMPIPAGTVPARLSPVFRDRDELPTTSDLGAAVEDALSQSRCLIVVCSPESAQSRWVNEEVLAFQRLGRGDRIHCLIVDGGPDPAAPVPFPSALEQVQSASGNGKSEPVAADARSFADGRSHALLKLIAGILGIRFDTLVQREQQRRHRNLFWITCTSLALVVVLAISTLVAVTSRREAVDQRSHAEGLVEFMIGDLRKKLEPDGKLATLDAVGKEALAYYASQKSEDLDAEGLARRARALHMIGEVYDLRGELDEALKVFEQAAESTAELVAREPDNGQRIFDHAQSVYWVGYIAYQRGNISVAEPAFQEYKRLAERLVAIDPGNEDWQAEVGYSNSNLGILLFEEGRLEDAAVIFKNELDSSLVLGNSKPNEYTQQLRTAQAHAWLADIRALQGRFKDATDQRTAETAIYERALSLDPKNNDAREALSISQMALARIAVYQGNLDGGIALLRKALDLGLTLHNIDRENAQWTNTTTAAYIALCDALVSKGEIEAASEASFKAKQLAEQLRERDSSVTAWRDRWTASLLAEANLAIAKGHTRDAMGLAKSAIRSLTKNQDGRRPSWQQNRFLARSLLLVADLETLQENTEAAMNAWKGVVAIGDNGTMESGPELEALRVVALLALHRTEEARPIVSKLSGIGYREKNYTSQLLKYDNEWRLEHSVDS